MPKINGNEIRPGNVLEHDGGLWAAVKVDHVKPGKGGAFAQVELRNLRNGSKLNERFRSADKVERVRLEQKDQQFLYCLLYTSPSPRDLSTSRMPSSA